MIVGVEEWKDWCVGVGMFDPEDWRETTTIFYYNYVAWESLTLWQMEGSYYISSYHLFVCYVQKNLECNLECNHTLLRKRIPSLF